MSYPYQYWYHGGLNDARALTALLQTHGATLLYTASDLYLSEINEGSRVTILSYTTGYRLHTLLEEVGPRASYLATTMTTSWSSGRPASAALSHAVTAYLVTTWHAVASGTSIAPKDVTQFLLGHKAVYTVNTGHCLTKSTEDTAAGVVTLTYNTNGTLHSITRKVGSHSATATVTYTTWRPTGMTATAATGSWSNPANGTNDGGATQKQLNQFWQSHHAYYTYTGGQLVKLSEDASSTPPHYTTFTYTAEGRLTTVREYCVGVSGGHSTTTTIMISYTGFMPSIFREN